MSVNVGIRVTSRLIGQYSRVFGVVLRRMGRWASHRSRAAGAGTVNTAISTQGSMPSFAVGFR